MSYTKIFKEDNDQRPGSGFRCPYCPTIYSQLATSTHHISNVHGTLLLKEREGYQDALKRQFNLSKRHERTIDMQRVEEHIIKFKDVLNSSNQVNYASLIEAVKLVSMEAMVFVGDETKNKRRRYLDSVENFKMLRNCECYSDRKMYDPL